jgi:predicted GNAT superfamily acetyltransferase
MRIEMSDWKLKILDKPSEMEAVEELQRLVWSGGETEVVPAHLLVAAVHNGGLLVGAFPAGREKESGGDLSGFVFGFPGLYTTPDGPRLKHYSHMLASTPTSEIAASAFLSSEPSGRWSGIKAWTASPGLSIPW